MSAVRHRPAKRRSDRRPDEAASRGSRRRALLVLAASGTALPLGGCGLLRSVGLLPSAAPPATPPVAPAPPPPADRAVELRLSAAPDINPDSGGRASPLRVQLYAGERDPRLGELGFEGVFGADAGGAPETLATLVVAPGGALVQPLVVPRATTWIGVAAAYREPWSALWFDALRIPDAADTGGGDVVTVDVRLELASVELLAGGSRS